MWPSQPRPPAPDAEGRLSGEGARTPSASRGRSSDESEGEDEDLRLQRRQWRQHTLRSLRQDLRQQQQGGPGGSSHGRSPGSAASAAAASSSSETGVDSERGWGRRPGSSSGMGPLGQQPQREQHRGPAGSAGNASSGGRGDHQGMLPDGYFLQSLKGGLPSIKLWTGVDVC